MNGAFIGASSMMGTGLLLHQRAQAACPSLVSCWPLGAPEALTLSGAKITACADPLGGLTASQGTDANRPTYSATGLDATTKAAVFGQTHWLTTAALSDGGSTWAAFIVLCELNNIQTVNWIAEWGNTSGGISSDRGIEIFFHQNAPAHSISCAARGNGAGSGFAWRQGASGHATTSKLVSRTYVGVWDTALASGETTVRQDEADGAGSMAGGSNGNNTLIATNAVITLGNALTHIIGLDGNISWIGLCKGTGTPPTANFDAVGVLLKAARTANNYWA